MQIERGASNTLVVMARVTLSPSYWLLHFTDIERGGNAYCVVQPGNSGGAFISLTFTETTAPVALDGEVLLAPPGNWNVKIYEQTSSTNLVPASANRLVKDVDIFVVGDGVADGGWTETCPTDGDECDPLSYSLVNSVFFELDGGSVPDPCGGNLTLTAPDATIRATDTVLIVAQVPSGSNYDLPQTYVTYVNAGGTPVALFLTDTGFDGLNLVTTDSILNADLRNSLGNVVGAAKVTAEDLMNDTVPIAPDGTITFDGLPVGTVPSGDTENLDCGTTIESAHVTLGSSGENGIYYISGTAGGKTRYQKNASYAFEYSGTRWVMIRPGSDHLAALGNETYPWLADWTGTGIAVDEGTISQYCGGNVEPCADLTIAINGTTYGTVADPCGATAPVDVHDNNGNDVGSLVSGAWVVAPPANVLHEYTTGGTWNKPTDPSFKGVWVFAAGAGGSGGTGYVSTGPSGGRGASGGGGGSIVRRWIPAASLGLTETYAIGAGGAGPTAVPSSGSAGGATLFGLHVEAKGGNGGVRGDFTARTVTQGGNATLNTPVSSGYSISGGNGGDGFFVSVITAAANAMITTAGAGGGGGGGAQTSTGLSGAGGNGGGCYNAGSLTAGGAGGAALGGAGTAGASNIYIDPFLGIVTATIGIGTGGGGGGGNLGATVAGAGAAGGLGAGGGGGGTTQTGGTAGAGGAGGNGFLLVYEVYGI